LTVKFLKKTGLTILIPIITGVVIMTLLACAYLLPTDRMKEHLRTTADVLEKEGTYFQITGEKGERHDNFTEAVYLSQAIVGMQDADLLSLVMNNYEFVHKDPGDPIEGVITAVNDPESVHLDDSYIRFFSGWLIILKPLLLVMGYTGVRMVCAYSCLLGTFVLCMLMYRRGLGKYIVSVLLSVLFLRPIAVWMSMAFAGIYLCMLIPCIAMLLMKKETLRQKAWLLFGLAGCITFSFNMNYFQLICFGVPMLFYYLIVGPEKPAELLKITLNLFAAWMIGYAGMMLFKWTAYSAATGTNVFEKMIHHALWRSGVDEGSRFETITRNVGTAFGNIWWDLLEIGFVAWILIQWKKAGGIITVFAAEVLLLVITVLMPVIRVAILANHSIHHADFVYRVFMIPVLAFNFLLVKRTMRTGSV